ncbi:hypothetical protein EBU71_13285 [bacterium]|nr:hypothetical protein [Candidatus Elulimicrobium humile]
MDIFSFSYSPYTSSQVGWIVQEEFENYSITLGTTRNEINSAGNVKRQFFYNTQNIDLEIFSSVYAQNIDDPQLLPQFTPATFDLTLNNLSLSEVDMVPFFKYSESENIDLRIKTPFSAIAPFIDYTNVNFDFIGNVNLTFDSQGILNQNITTQVQTNTIPTQTGNNSPLGWIASEYNDPSLTR